jgi:hypothetical protein
MFVSAMFVSGMSASISKNKSRTFGVARVPCGCAGAAAQPRGDCPADIGFWTRASGGLKPVGQERRRDRPDLP